MNFISLFTSFTGRINRAKWWLGLVALMVFGGVVNYLLNPAYFEAAMKGGTPTLTLGQFIWSLVLIVPTTALVAKRLNDRNWGGWATILYLLLALAMAIPPYFGYFLPPYKHGQWELIAYGICMILAVAFLIDNGFLRGTPGDNRYGANPIANDPRTADGAKTGGDWAA